MTFFHVTNRANREGIERDGLVPVEHSSEAYIGPRTWLTTSREFAEQRAQAIESNPASYPHSGPQDIWEISEAAIRTDLNFGDDCYVTCETIPPSAMERSR